MFYGLKIRKIILLFVLLLLLVNSVRVLALDISIIQADVSIQICGNGIAEGTEECDGSDFDGQLCSSLGFSQGTLSCAPDCTFNTSQCVFIASPNTSSGYSGSGNLDGFLNVSGFAYPNSEVVLLKDGIFFAKTNSDNLGNFYFDLALLELGNYQMSVYVIQDDSLSSALFNFPISVTSNKGINVNKIFLSPTIYSKNSEIRKGDNIVFEGRSVPNSVVNITFEGKTSYTVSVISDSSGFYKYSLDSSTFDFGQYVVRSRSLNTDISGVGSRPFVFTVGTSNELLDGDFLKGDFNNDNKVDLVDFSIIAFWYQKNSFPERLDLNFDGKIDIVDFSIMVYYWTS